MGVINVMIKTSFDSIFIIYCAILTIPLSIFIILIHRKVVKKNHIKSLKNNLNHIFTRYTLITIDMPEHVMLSIMNFKYDKSITTEYTLYRFVYITKGSSGSVNGGMYGNIGYISGSSEIHDESVVIIKCIDGKVKEVIV